MNQSTISDQPKNIEVPYALTQVPLQLNKYFGLVLFISGNLTLIGNAIVFSSKSFRKRACSVYILVEAFMNIFYFNYVLLTRMLQRGFGIPIMSRYDVFCKTRQFASIYVHEVVITLFVLATIDRILSVQRSATLRQWSNRIPLAYKLSAANILFWFLLLCHRLILYRRANGSCGPEPGFYTQYDGYFETVASAVYPFVIIPILSYLMVSGVRNIMRRRVDNNQDTNPTTSQQQAKAQQIDTQITKMLTMQTLIATVTFVIYGFQVLYSSITDGWTKSALRVAWENAIIEFIRLQSYLFATTGFYVWMISSNTYRKVLFTTITCQRHRNAVHPTRQTVVAITHTT